MDEPWINAPAAMMTSSSYPGHLPGLRRDVGIHRRPGLDAAAEAFQVLRRFERYGLDDVVPRFLWARLRVKAQLLQHSCTERGGFQRLGRSVRGEEKALVELTVRTQSAAAFAADAGDGEAIGRALHEVGAAAM